MAQLSQEAEDRLIQIDQRIQYLFDLSIRHGSSDEITQEREDLILEKSSILLGSEISTVKAKKLTGAKSVINKKTKVKIVKKVSVPKKK